MAIKDLNIDLERELNFWGARVFKRVKQKFVGLDINRSANPKEKYTGNLYRTMYWEVYNAAGGNQALITFFYKKYGDFVQWGVGGRKYGDKNKQYLWPIPEVSGKDPKPIKAPDTTRYAKLYMRREIRYHSKWLMKRLVEQYAYTGNLLIVRGLSEATENPETMNKWIVENKDMLTKGFLDMMNFK